MAHISMKPRNLGAQVKVYLLESFSDDQLEVLIGCQLGLLLETFLGIESAAISVESC